MPFLINKQVIVYNNIIKKHIFCTFHSFFNTFNGKEVILISNEFGMILKNVVLQNGQKVY